MSESSSDDSDCRLFSERSEWDDVTPVKQQDSENPVVAIQYSEVFADCHSYFRAVLASGEKSERVLNLTQAVIDCNAANYTAWKYRRDVILAINFSIDKELETVASMLNSYPKNFQIWHHRRELLLAKGSAEGEREVVGVTLEKDAKNYHAWCHRRWVVTQFDLLNGEEEYAVSHLEEDFRNNSAWNYLYFIVETKLGLNPQLARGEVPLEEHIEVRKAEIRRGLSYLKNSASNEAMHNYLVGHMLPKHHTKEVFQACAPLVEDAMPHGAEPVFTWPKSTLAEIYSFAHEQGVDGGLFTGLNGKTFKERANELYAELAEIDEIRAKYWRSVVIE